MGMSPCPVRKMMGSVTSVSASSLLKVEAAQPREADVEHETSWSMPPRAAQERLSAREDFYGQSHGREQSPEGFATALVIVDDKDDRPLRAHRIPMALVSPSCPARLFAAVRGQNDNRDPSPRRPGV